MDPSLSPPQRVVLLLDLHPLLHQNPNSSSKYLAQIQASAHRILSFSPLSSSLFAFKLFISSLSPLLSSSKLHQLLGRSPPPFSFNRPHETLASLSRSLGPLRPAGPADPSSPPRASLLAKFLLQLEHDYSWEPDSSSSAAAAGSGGDPPQPPCSNLVLLFSPLYGDTLGLQSRDFDGFFASFAGVFGPVNDKLLSRDIHFSWIGMNFDGDCKLGFLKRGIRELGWGFCSEDAILVGSALVPFGLIFPYMGCKLGCLSSSGRSIGKGRADLVLGITDAHGKPLECKSCCLEVVQLNLARERPDFWALFSEKISGGGLVKIRVSEVRRRDEWAQVSDYSDWIVLLRGISSDSGKEAGDPERECAVDRVLELLCCTEKGEFTVEQPLWQLLLAFLFRKNYWASVSISDSAGNSLKGVLKPFTVNYALLGITENNNVVSCQLAGKEAPKTFDCGIADSSKTKDGRRKRNKMDGHLLQDVTWSTFYKAVFRQDEYCAPEMDLEEMYFATKNTKSKKLSFLKCWMREMKKSSDYCQIKPNEPKTPLSVNEEVKERLEGPDPELGLNASSSPDRGENHNLPLNQEFLSFSCKEHWEAFLESIPQKIEHGTFSKEVDLWNLAKRLVSWSIDALYAKFENNEIDNSVNKELEDCSEMSVRSEVSRLLLMKPKDLLVKRRSSNSESATLRQFPANYSTENIIRQHELQILFRMELLRSKIAVSFEENLKQKMVKEICSLLQNIEFYLQGDFLSGESLLEFAGKTIKSRYARSLGDVIHKIYEQMEFFSFDDDELEASESLLGGNSEEAKRDENESNNTPKDTFEPMTIASSSQNNAYLHANDAKELQPEADNVHDRRLMKAHKQRDRARRLSSFTSWVPDLRRVWALKHPGMEKPALDYLPSSKCKKMKRERNKTEVVCETPMTRKQHLHMQNDEGRHLEISSFDDNSYRSLSKALFLNE